MNDIMEKASQRIASVFIKNTNIKEFNPAWLVAIVSIIIEVVKYCNSKKDTTQFRNAASSALSGWKRYVGVGRIVRRNLTRAIKNNLPEANAEELIRAILETAVDAHEDELSDLIGSISKIDHIP